MMLHMHKKMIKTSELQVVQDLQAEKAKGMKRKINLERKGIINKDHHFYRVVFIN